MMSALKTKREMLKVEVSRITPILMSPTPANSSMVVSMVLINCFCIELLVTSTTLNIDMYSMKTFVSGRNVVSSRKGSSTLLVKTLYT